MVAAAAYSPVTLATVIAAVRLLLLFSLAATAVALLPFLFFVFDNEYRFCFDFLFQSIFPEVAFSSGQRQYTVH